MSPAPDTAFADSDTNASGGTSLALDALLPKENMKLPSQLGKGAREKVLKGWFRADATFSQAWRRQAMEDFDFRAGEQWSEEDKAILREQLRPITVFNRVLTILKAVAGMEINGRHEVQFLPMNTQDTAPNELLSNASKWMASGCDGEDEESEAFDNCSTCGMGWTENRVSYEETKLGKYAEESIDPREMYWDKAARKRNLTDARRISRLKRVPLAEAMQKFPGYSPEQLNAQWAIDFGGVDANVQKSYEERLIRDENGSLQYDSLYDEDNEVAIVHTQWYELETYYIAADVATGATSELSEEEYQVWTERMGKLGMDFKAARLQRRVYFEAFIGDGILQSGKSGIQGHFIWQCITGELDRRKGTWFGLVKTMRDPQMWANKWLSQTLHILNTTAKGGIIAEEDAFEDQQQAEDTYAKPDSITWAAPGALSGQNPKIIEKKGIGITQGHVELMQFAISAIRECTGINLELLGQKDINQPGVLEAQRKQAAMTVLATLFDSLRRFRKNIGRIRLYMIQHYFSDGRLIRVAGPTAAQMVPLLKQQTLGEYDTIIDDTPTSPNQKQANWAVIAPMIGLFKEQLAAKPELLAALLEFSPLPAALVELVKRMVQQDAQDPEKQQLKTLTQRLAVAGQVAKINKDQSTAEMQNAKAGSTQATASYDLAMAQNLLQKGEFDKLKLHLDTLTSAAKMRESQAKAESAQHGAVNDRLDLMDRIRGNQHQRRMDTLDQLHQHAMGAHERTMDHAQHGLDTIGALGGFLNDIASSHAQMAKAHRDRVGAVVDATQPAEEPEEENANG